jgi:hypothetical protein
MAARISPFNGIQTTFNAGELSPAMRGRVDVQRYGNGCAKLENFLLSPQGGLFRRPGTRFVKPAKLANKKTRLIPFSFSNIQSYILEFGDQYIRFYKDEGRIESPPNTPVEIASPYTEADLDGLYYAQSADVLYLAHPNHAPRKLSRLSHTSWTLQVIDFQDGPYLDMNTDDAQAITASAVTGTVTLTSTSPLFEPGHVGAIFRLEESTKSKHVAWAQGVCYETGIEVQSDGLVYVLSGTNAATNEARLVGSSAWQPSVGWGIGRHCHHGENVYRAQSAGSSGNTAPTHTNGTVSDGGINWLYVGKRSESRAPVHTTGTESDGTLSWTYLHSGFGVVKITGFTNSTTVTATVLKRLPTSVLSGTIRWREGAWSAVRGYPSCVSFFAERLVFASTSHQPQTLWFSETGQFEAFAPTDRGTEVVDTNAITLTLASGRVNKILWLSGQTKLHVGTAGGEWTIGPAASSKAFAPDNAEARLQTSFGSDAVQSVAVGTSVLFVQRGGARVRELVYNFEIDGYIAKDLTLLAEHLPRTLGGVRQMAYQQEPFSIVWCAMNDGSLCALTYLRDQEVIGWARHRIGGVDAFVESVAVIPGGPSGEDQLWLCVRRTVNGATVRHVEFLENIFWPATAQDKDGMWFVDSGVSGDFVSPVTTVTGLNHLEGQQVTVVVDGSVIPPCTVSGGTITLPKPGTKVRAGLAYTSTMESLPVEFPGQLGTIQGQIKRIHKITLRLLNSLGFRYSTPGESPEREAHFRDASMPMDVSPGFFTGDFPILIDQSANRQGVFKIRQSQPYPLNILAAMPEGTVYEA